MFSQIYYTAFDSIQSKAIIIERESFATSFVAALVQGKSFVMPAGVARKSGPLRSQSGCSYYHWHIINEHAGSTFSLQWLKFVCQRYIASLPICK